MIKRLFLEKKNQKENFYFLLGYFLFGIVVYQMLIVNELPNPDSIWNGMFYKDNWQWECSLGRFMIGGFQKLFGNVINPATNALLCIFILALIGIVLNDIFEIKDKIIKLFIGIFIILSPTVTGILSYHYCSVYYILAYLFAVSSCWYMLRAEDIRGVVLPSFLICFSLGTYQAYIGIIAVVGLIITVKKTLDITCTKEHLIKFIVKYFFSVVGGIALYLLMNKVSLKILNIPAEVNRGFSKIGHIPFKRVPELLLNCYVYSGEYYFKDTLINNCAGNINLRNINVIWCIILLIVLSVKIYSMRKGRIYQLVAILEVMLLPIAIMCITVAASDVSIYESTGMIMLPTTVYLYVLLLVVLQTNIGCKSNKYNSCIYRVSIIVSVCMIIALYNFSSAMQVYQNVCLKKMDYVAENIAREIEKYIYDDKEYRICIAGNMEAGNYPELYDDLANLISWTTASYGMVWDDFNGIQNCWKNYIAQYYGVEYSSCNLEEYSEIIKSREFQEASIFPKEESIYIYKESIIVIKLSELE